MHAGEWEIHCFKFWAMGANTNAYRHSFAMEQKSLDAFKASLAGLRPASLLSAL